MAIDVETRVPSEAETLRKIAEAQRHLTPTQRLAAVADLLAAQEARWRAEGTYEAEMKHQDALEKEWQTLMKEFIKKHLVVEEQEP